MSTTQFSGIDLANKIARELGVPVGTDIDRLVAVCEALEVYQSAFSIDERMTPIEIDGKPYLPAPADQVQRAYDLATAANTEAHFRLRDVTR